MSTVPDKSEWDTGNLPPFRRAYLESAKSFEAIAKSLAVEAEILEAWIEPGRDMGEEGKDTRQIIFCIKVSPETYDLFYNAPDGLRGRHWQDPDEGLLATHYLLGLLKPALMQFAEARPPQLKSKHKHAQEMTLNDVQTSLDVPSAKVWVREKDGSNKPMIVGGPELIVRRWENNETDLLGKGRQWRDAPSDGQIEIKGGLIDSQRVEHIPISKRHRHHQIHRYGFT